MTRPAGAEGRRAYLFTDIVPSANLVDLIGDEAWSALVALNDRAMRELFAAHGSLDVETRGDGFFAIFDSPTGAVACAVAIQRALAEHREQNGIAPQARIGLHAADGAGVHVAARIAALADGDQILASTSSLAGMPGLELSERRMVTIKEIEDPVEVAVIAWR